jgi:GNAT superfamily N-acetyltransferase
MMAGEDWTRHLRGLPLVEEIPPLRGEAYGRDLRGADLRLHLKPEVRIAEASEHAAAVVAGIALEAMQNNTPLPGISPFHTELESAEQTAVAMRRGEVFLLARALGRPVGTVRIARRREFDELTMGSEYAEVSGLAVLPAYRRQGIGASLLDAAEQHAADSGHGWVLLRTVHETGLVAWYRTRGYDVASVRQLSFADSPTFLDVIMCRRLRVPQAPDGTPLGVRRALGVEGSAAG